GTARPITPVRPERRPRADRLGRYPSSLMAERTRVRVLGRTCGKSLITFDTVLIETPATRATSCIVGLTSVSAPLLGAGFCRLCILGLAIPLTPVPLIAIVAFQR